MVFYGTLMLGFGVQERLGIHESLQYIGPCRVPGTLYDLGSYPGLIESNEFSQGELFLIKDPIVIPMLDRYEDYSPSSPGSSLYIRKAMTLTTPPIEAWVYYYNRRVSQSQRIPRGNWRHHLEK